MSISDEAFEQQVADCDLPAPGLDHEAHLRLAWICIRKYGIDEAIDRVEKLLMAYVDHVGAADKYNRTLTVASVKVVHHFTGRCKGESFADLLREHPRLKNGFKELIAAHYGFDIFSSAQAKQEYLEPDLAPFD